MRKVIENALSSVISLMPLRKLKFPLSLCVDVTHRCNLNCRHCYFRTAGYKNELSDEAWLDKLKLLRDKHNPIFCSWIGGEPMLRRDVIERGRKLFAFNWIVTNGTMEIPAWDDCIFLVSVDGTKEHHEYLRGKGTYEKIKRNVLESKGKIFLNMVITKKNHKCIEDFVEEWKTHVSGISLYFYSPVKGARNNEEFFVKPEQRDEIVGRLMRLRKKYGDFILMPKRLLEAITSENYKKFTGKNCIIRKCTLCLDPEGRKKEPCLFEGVVCDECGCIMPPGLKLFLSGDRETIRTGLIMTKKIRIKSLNVFRHF